MREICGYTSCSSVFFFRSLTPFLLVFFLAHVAEGGEAGYADMKNGTIKDEYLVKYWAQNDSYRDLKLWVSYKGAKEYVKKKNKERLGGFNDWRLPLKSELKSLYHRKIKGRPTYDRSDTLHIDSAFNISYCYFWTKEEIDVKFVWQVSLCNGRVYKSIKTNVPGNAGLLIRP